MPQGMRTVPLMCEFRSMLANINFLFIGLTVRKAPASPRLVLSGILRLTALATASLQVLILLDRTYLGRFWTQFEGWLSMQCASADGLVSADESARRCVIECVHDAPERLKGALVEEWSEVTAETAHRKLSASDVSVTNASDKEGQLPKIFILDSKVREIARILGLQASTTSSSISARLRESSLKPSETAQLARENAMLRAENSELKQTIQEMDRRIIELQEELVQSQRSSSAGLLGLLSSAVSERARSSSPHSPAFHLNIQA